MPKSQELDNRVRHFRQKAGLTMEQLGQKAGEILGRPLHFTTIAKYERSQRPLNGEVLSAIAHVLNVAPEDLVGTIPMHIAVRMVPLVGKIAAGNWKEAVLDPEGYIPAPVRGGFSFALRPEGDSMDLVVGPDAIIVIDPEQLDLHEGRLYAVMNAEGETTFKRYRESPPRLEPVSSNPAHQDIPVGREPFTVIGRVVWQGSSL